MDDHSRYPIGQQDFKTLCNDNAFYIGKTAFVEKIATSKARRNISSLCCKKTCAASHIHASAGLS